MKANAPDYACRDRDGCGWVQWPERQKSAPLGGDGPGKPAPASHPEPVARNATDAGQLMNECVSEGITQTKRIALGLAGGQSEDPMVVGPLIEACEKIAVTLFVARNRQQS